MTVPVNTVAAGGIAVVDVTSTTPNMGAPVSEAAPGKGTAVTKVATYGKPVTFVAAWSYPTAPALTLATLDGVASSATLSNGNLTATHASNGSANGARSATALSSGKYYFEMKVNQTSAYPDALGVMLSALSYADLINANAGTTVVVYGSGFVFSNTVSSGGIGTVVANDIVGVAVDLDNHKAWLRRNGGNWLGQAIGSQNPVGAVGGAPMAAGSYTPAVGFMGIVGDGVTANFGQSAFAAGAPTGFGSWGV